jgi:hypothetical protein
MDTSCNMDINTPLSLQTLDNILYILPPGISKVLAVVKTPTPKKICALLVHSISAICSLELNQSGGSRSIVNSFTCHFVDRPSLVFRALEDPMTRMKDSPSMLYFQERRKACCYERRCLTRISANTLVNSIWRPPPHQGPTVQSLSRGAQSALEVHVGKTRLHSPPRQAQASQLLPIESSKQRSRIRVNVRESRVRRPRARRSKRSICRKSNTEYVHLSYKTVQWSSRQLSDVLQASDTSECT